MKPNTKRSGLVFERQGAIIYDNVFAATIDEIDLVYRAVTASAKEANPRETNTKSTHPTLKDKQTVEMSWASSHGALSPLRRIADQNDPLRIELRPGEVEARVNEAAHSLYDRGMIILRLQQKAEKSRPIVRKAILYYLNYKYS